MRRVQSLSRMLPIGLVLALSAGMWPLSLAAALQITVTIKPIHSLVSAVTDGIVVPRLLLEHSESPHTFQLKPSGFRALDTADVLIWVGEGIEGFVGRLANKFADSLQVIELIDESGIALLPYRNEELDWVSDHGAFSDEHHDHHLNADGHIWLDPVNAIQIVRTVASRLGEMDPGNATRYATNAEAYVQKLEQLTDKVGSRLSDVKLVPFIVFHDSFQYFEHRFDLTGAGVVALRPEVQPGAAGLRHTLKIIQDRRVRCLFSEPQFPSRSIDLLLHETGVRHAVLDPLATGFEKGPQLYLLWLAETAEQISDCLGE